MGSHSLDSRRTPVPDQMFPHAVCGNVHIFYFLSWTFSLLGGNTRIFSFHATSGFFESSRCVVIAPTSGLTFHSLHCNSISAAGLTPYPWPGTQEQNPNAPLTTVTAPLSYPELLQPFAQITQIYEALCFQMFV